MCVSICISVLFIRHMNAYVEDCNSFADLHCLHCLIFFRTNWMIIGGMKLKYQPDATLPVNIKDDHPVFAKLCHLYIIGGNQPLVYCHNYTTVKFNIHYSKHRMIIFDIN